MNQRLRPEMIYHDRFFPLPSEREAALRECAWHLPRPAIFYTTEVEEAKTLYGLLTDEEGFARVGCFHGETRPRERRKLLDRWRCDELDLMVATSAFGLGVDKADVRAVVHACFPEDLNRYYQEVGRGGRDGASSVCLLLPTRKDQEVDTSSAHCAAVRSSGVAGNTFGSSATRLRRRRISAATAP